MIRHTLLACSSAALLLSLGLVACESSSNSDPSPSPDGGGTFDGGNNANDGATSDGGDDGEPLPSICPTPTGAPIQHSGNIEKDETWGPGLHDAVFDIGVRKNATLTIEPCAVVRFVPDRGLSVGTGNAGDGGKIVAKGKRDMPIVIQGKDDGQWGGVLVSPLGFADLAYVTIKKGGDRGSRGGAGLHLLGDQDKPLQPLATVNHVIIEGSVKYGASLEARGCFTPESHDLTIKGSGDTAMRVGAPALGTIPTGKYKDNTIGAIRTSGAGRGIIDADVTIHDRGVPYVVGGDGEFSQISVLGANGTVPVLTIEPGVTMKFYKSERNSGLFIERASSLEPARGALRAIGTAAQPITFTSMEANPAPGDWVGIWFESVPSAKNRIDYARIEYAGGDTGTIGFSCGTPGAPNPASNEAAIGIFGVPASQFVTNTIIRKSGTNAIERGWTGAPIDFLPTNTFEENRYCRQTYPRPVNGSCGDPPPCD